MITYKQLISWTCIIGIVSTLAYFGYRDYKRQTEVYAYLSEVVAYQDKEKTLPITRASGLNALLLERLKAAEATQQPPK